jgi:hypothetical protein
LLLAILYLNKEYSMKNVFKLIGIIALAAVIGFSMAACGGDDDEGGGSVPSQLVGEWNSSDGRGSIVFKSDGEIDSLQGYFFFILSSSILRPTSGTIVFGYSEMLGETGRFSYSINGDTMTISNSNFYDFPDGTYQRGSGGGSGTGGTAPTITTTSLPNGTAGTAYSQTLEATGDTPITWSRDSGTLPAGLSLGTTGVISGTPTTAGSSTFTVKAANAKGSATKTLTITIAASGGSSGSWTAVANSTFGESGIKAIAFGGSTGQEKFVAGGSGGKMAYSSDNGKTWTAVNTGTLFDYDFNGQTRKAEIRGIAWGSDKFVAGGSYGKMATSTDGITWTAADSKFGTRAINAIAWGSNKFVAVGDTAAYSSDGVSWTETYNLGGIGSWTNVIAYGNNKFVAGCGFLRDHAVMYSTDGITWTGVDVGMGDTKAIAWGGNKFVLAGESGFDLKLATSTDGVTWTDAADIIGNDFGIFGYIIAIAYGNNKFVAGSNYGGMAYSSDGITWTKIDATGIFGSGQINAIAYGNGTFVAGGTDGNGGKIAYLTGN